MWLYNMRAHLHHHTLHGLHTPTSTVDCPFTFTACTDSHRLCFVYCTTFHETLHVDTNRRQHPECNMLLVISGEEVSVVFSLPSIVCSSVFCIFFFLCHLGPIIGGVFATYVDCQCHGYHLPTHPWFVLVVHWSRDNVKRNGSSSYSNLNVSRGVNQWL